MNFNLIDDPWIPILRHNGTYERVGALRALAEAQDIRQLAAPNPMDRFAVFRFLLALLYWCRGNPERERGTKTDSSEVWLAKLADLREHFNLFGDGARFYQDPGAKRPRPTTDLIQEIPTGNNFWHFHHSTDGEQGLCPSCCAMGLVRLPLFSVSGLPNMKSGINGSPPIYVMPQGKNLDETLRMNWIDRGLLGDPAWLWPEVRPEPGKEVPTLTGLTVLSRRVWLHALSDNPEVCDHCGRHDSQVVRTCDFESAGDLENDRWNDPHVLYERGAKRILKKAADLTASKRFKMDRPWPDLFARIQEDASELNSDDINRDFAIIAFATHQMKYIDVWERTVRLGSSNSNPNAMAANARGWEAWGDGLAKAVSRSVSRGTSRAASNKELPEVATALKSVRPDVEHWVSVRMAELMSTEDGVNTAVDDVVRPFMSSLARSLAPGFTIAATDRRAKIAAFRPDMSPVPKSAKGKTMKKGGAK
ncbi:MAG: type I-E CRISPR-associated protein Cse1/CasA [Deltaproteobacteria bacterium]|nr:type I-E CRISPR-associated protein Cse1/CasA [Deltaproteobacteria bacterium]